MEIDIKWGGKKIASFEEQSVRLGYHYGAIIGFETLTYTEDKLKYILKRVQAYRRKIKKNKGKIKCQMQNKDIDVMDVKPFI